MQHSSCLTPSTRACLDSFLSDCAEAAEVLDTTSAHRLHLPPSRLWQQALTHLVTHNALSSDANSISIGALLLAIASDRPGLERHLTQEADAGQWWRLTRRPPVPLPPPSPSALSDRRLASLAPLDSAHVEVSRTPQSTPAVVWTAGLTPVRPTAATASTPLPALTPAVPLTEGPTIPTVVQRAPVEEAPAAPSRPLLLREVKTFLSGLMRHLSVDQLRRHGMGFTMGPPPPSSDDASQSQTLERESSEVRAAAADTTPHFPTVRALLAHHTVDSDRPRALASTGCAALDATLRAQTSASTHTGGFRFGWLTEVSGEAGSGKTQLVLQCLLQQIAVDLVTQDTSGTVGGVGGMGGNGGADSRPSRAYLYVVSEDVPASRLGALARGTAARVCAATAASQSVHATHRPSALRLTAETLLSRLQVRLITDLAELQTLLAADGALERVAAAHGPAGCLLVLDSIAAAVAGSERVPVPPLAKQMPSVSGMGMALKSFAVRHQACVLVVNQIRSVPVAAQVASAPLKRRREADAAVQCVEAAMHSAVWHRPLSAVVVLGGPTRGVETLPALGAAWSTSAWHMRVSLGKRTTGHTTHDVVAGASLRDCLVFGGPDLAPARAVFRITEDGIEDDA